MQTFTIDSENNISAFATAEEAAAATQTPFDSFASETELAELVAGFPTERLLGLWNSLPGGTSVKGCSARYETRRILGGIARFSVRFPRTGGRHRRAFDDVFHPRFLLCGGRTRRPDRGQQLPRRAFRNIRCRPAPAFIVLLRQAGEQEENGPSSVPRATGKGSHTKSGGEEKGGENPSQGRWPVLGREKTGQNPSCSPAARRRTMD